MDFRAGRSPDGFRDPATFSDTSSAPLIRDGDMVVFFEGREPIGFDRMKPKTIWQCRHGAFHHDEIIGKPFGSRVFSRTTKGYVYTLSPTPELWSHVVPNRTQIVQDFDQSIVIFRLDLKPGDVVVESGTGSGVMSTAIMRTIAPSGFLHSFEFNEIRATRAQEEFEENALGGLAKVAHRDVCAARADGGGFGEELDGKADAVFLDLPEPWLAVAHVKLALKPGKKVCSYSPCIEQVMKTCEAFRSEGFHSVTTIEFRLRNINYTEVQLDVPDFGSQTPVPPPPEPSAPVSEAESTTTVTKVEGAPRVVGGAGDGEARATASGTPGEDAGGEGDAQVGVTVAGEEGAKINSSAERSEEGREVETSIGATSDGPVSKENGTDTASAAATPAPAPPVPDSENRKRQREEDHRSSEETTETAEGVSGAGRGRNERLPSKAAIRAAEAAALAKGAARKPPLKLVCAQPFPLMRGHTAFLTFATAPVISCTEAAAAEPGTKTGGGTLPAGGRGDGAGSNGAATGEFERSASEMDVCWKVDDGRQGGRESATTHGAEGETASASVSTTTESPAVAKR